MQIVIVRGTGRGDSCMKVNKIKAKKTVAFISPMLALYLIKNISILLGRHIPFFKALILAFFLDHFWFAQNSCFRSCQNGNGYLFNYLMVMSFSSL